MKTREHNLMVTHGILCSRCFLGTRFATSWFAKRDQFQLRES